MNATSEHFEEISVTKPFMRFLRENARYKVAYGGRGGAKSESIARILLAKAVKQQMRILCTRQYQASIRDSVHKLLSDIIRSYPVTLDPYFKITNDSIVCNGSGSEFIFKGLQNIIEIKSMQAVNICWVEEAVNVTADNWNILIPTIRAENSEIWVSFNPINITDPTYQRFVLNRASDDQITLSVTYRDNPFFPGVLRREMEQCKKNDYDLYLHIWEGNPKTLSDAIIFKGKYEIKEFQTMPCPRWRLGADWGFAADPSTLIAMYINENNLYIRHEVYGHGIEIRDMEQFWKPVLDKTGKQTVYADCARPETISDANRYSGTTVTAAKKWAGSVEDGIEFIRGKFGKIYIHPECKHTAEEFGRYSYKVDRKTEEILPVVADAFNHCIDAVRYGLDGYIRNNSCDYGELL
ncbi:MAG: PBSX family phage terminase large subunit [Deferribacteraceae bacterium]|jgi:phage terminase large subunit|nr:PBSX family phage terminase large subunit [Deferribacteraceae bacterium]